MLNQPFLTPPGVTNSGVWADFDNDGTDDLYLANFVTVAGGSVAAPNVLYRNAGPPDFDLIVVDLDGNPNASPSRKSRKSLIAAIDAS